MGTNVIVNGQEYADKNVVQLFGPDGAPVLFQLMGEASGGTADGIVAMACGEFSVAAAMTGEYTIQHGMTVAPDVVCVIPKYWYDTQDNNFAILAASRHASVTGGRRTLSGDGQTHFMGGISAAEMDWSTEIALGTSSLAKFRSTYLDADGNTGTQVYLWIAVKFKEDADA